MFNEYEPQNSYYAGTPYENPNNPKNEYDPQQALKLLADAGWKSRDSQGRLVKNGAAAASRAALRHQQIVRAAPDHLSGGPAKGRHHPESSPDHSGDASSSWSNQRQFPDGVSGVGRVAISRSRDGNWHSSLADVNNTNNITGFKNARVDELCKQYDKTFDVEAAHSRSFAKSTASWRTPISTSCSGTLRSPASPTGTSSERRQATLTRTGDYYTALSDVVDRSRQGRTSCSRPCAIRP